MSPRAECTLSKAQTPSSWLGWPWRRKSRPCFLLEEDLYCKKKCISFVSQKMMHLFSIAALCLKITEKVSFNIASEASYVYILSGQK